MITREKIQQLADVFKELESANDPNAIYVSAVSVGEWLRDLLEAPVSGVELITQERQEQLMKHGWSKEHDTTHSKGELAKVAATLAVIGTDAKVICPDDTWGTGNNPWGLEEKLRKDSIHRLKVCGALIAAQLDNELSLLNIEQGAQESDTTMLNHGTEPMPPKSNTTEYKS